MQVERSRNGSKSWPPAREKRSSSAIPAIWIFNMDAHTDATRYHAHGQEKPEDAGKPGAWKARTPGLEGAGQKKEQQCHLRWLATLRGGDSHHQWRASKGSGFHHA